MLYRAQGILDLDEVQKKKIVFVGLGSLGSLTLANLAYPWREIVLIDPEKLTRENVERHLLGPDKVGKSKVGSVASWLSSRGLTFPKVKVYPDNAENVLSRHADSDLVIVTTGTSPTQFWVNSWCMSYNIPTLYSGVWEQGRGGDVVAIVNPLDVCFLCASHFLGRINDDPSTGYGVDPETLSEGLNAVPALRWVVCAIASHCADLALQILEGGDLESQVLIHTHAQEPILTLTPGREQKALAAYVRNQANLGLVPHMSMDRLNGKYQFQVRRSVLSFALSRWSSCPLHATESVSLEDMVK